MMEPIPEGITDPVAWAEKHIESLAPTSAKEIEYALKFGSDRMRYTAAIDSLAMKGLTTKPKEASVIPQAMVFNFQGPTTAQGVPIMPFSNAQKTLVDSTATPVTVVEATTDADKDKTK
jgi:hypothetical protein